MTKKPVEVEVITYQVGFGDCFLLKVHYDRGRPHTTLIDFGSMHSAGFSMSKIAREIRADCDGRLDVVVATHRHMDHVGGFRRTAKGGGTGKIIRDLSPRVVVMPWTEDPKAQPGAVRPTKRYGSHGPAFAARLADMQAVAASAASYSKMLRFHGERGLRKRLKVLGENNLGNRSSMENLRTMGRRHYYAFHGMKLGLARELPGVKVHVLGPPTLKQTEAIRKQRREDADEFWHFQAQATSPATLQGGPFPGSQTLRDPVWARWARRRFRHARAEQMVAIVRSLDHALNNTSLILLLRVGNKSLLFPGDAQYENWMYALSKPWVRRLLRGVDVYKVGHHGSLNATPMSMYDLFENKRGDDAGDGAMHSILSTLPGEHGSEENRTEVPRERLVRTLRAETHLHSTTDLPAEAISTRLRLPVA